ncbi:hypothetical protein ACFR97_14820 [Haloplanus litoreus]|uniref:Uncharacterized protein n=1 Tax=Haloplanus litoreus TaxID=767515 RepID=A0ABD5ZWA5_9EURY
MSTHQQPATESTRTAPTLTDGRWQDETSETATPVSTTAAAKRQFATDHRYRLPNLVDEENRAMF